MRSVMQWMLLVAAGSLTLISCTTAPSPQATAGKIDMTFFVTSVGTGKGADLGGLRAQTNTVSRSLRRWARAAALGALI